MCLNITRRDEKMRLTPLKRKISLDHAIPSRIYLFDILKRAFDCQVNFHFVYLRCMFSNKYLMILYILFYRGIEVSIQEEKERERERKAFWINEIIFVFIFFRFFLAIGNIKRFPRRKILNLILYYRLLSLFFFGFCAIICCAIILWIIL